MTRLLGLAVLLAGCVSDEWAKNSLNGVPVKTPDPAQVSPASFQAAQRVETLGQRIVEQNTFTGLDPLFHTLGVAEPVLFHRGPDELFISEGLVRRCKTDAQLAAVLCGELGRMMAERRSAKAVGVDLQSVPDRPSPDALAAGEVASSASAARDLTPEPPDGAAALRFARDLHRGAGFGPAEMDKAGALLAGVKREAGIGRQVAGPAPAPVWQR